MEPASRRSLFGWIAALGAGAAVQQVTGVASPFPSPLPYGDLNYMPKGTPMPGIDPLRKAGYDAFYAAAGLLPKRVPFHVHRTRLSRLKSMSDAAKDFYTEKHQRDEDTLINRLRAKFLPWESEDNCKEDSRYSTGANAQVRR